MKKAFIVIFLVSVGLNLMFFITKLNNKNNEAPAKVNGQPTQRAFLSPRIFAEKQNDILINFVPLRSAVREYIEAQDEEIGYYFEYLPSGTSIGVNDRLEINVASLVKVPVIMVAYKEIEIGRLKKSDELLIESKDVDISFGDLWQKGQGTKISVMDAINLALKESDNTAANLLIHKLPGQSVEDVYDSLDIPKNFEKGHPIISPKNYVSILKSLYLSSYLTQEHSNEILELLTQTKFDKMLPAGVHKDIKVAHKIGVYDTQGYYSDCGIVYVPSRPYVLCVMTKSDEVRAIEHISLLSKMTFEYVTKISK